MVLCLPSRSKIRIIVFLLLLANIIFETTPQTKAFIIPMKNEVTRRGRIFFSELKSVTGAPSPTNTTIDQLPNFETCPYRPSFLQCGINTVAKGYSTDESLPLGIPFEFETPLFKGKILVRLRNSPSSENPVDHAAYFSKTKCVRQVVVQGKFKEAMNVSDVFYGEVFTRPLKPAPPPSTSRIIKAGLKSVVPGLIMDLSLANPKVITPYAGCAHTLSASLPGDEPEITQFNIPENNEIIFGESHVATAKKRRQVLSKPNLASKYKYDTKYIYTFQALDEVLDVGTYYLKLPILGKFDLTNILNGQPMSISAMTSDDRFLFNFRVWHERLFDRKP